MATDAAEVLPYLCRLTKTWSGLGAKPLRDGVNNTAIGLVRNDAFDLRNVQFAATQDFLGRGVHGRDGVLESLLAVHAQVMHPRGDGLMGRRTGWNRRPGMQSRPARLPSEPMQAVNNPCACGRLRKMAAPAPSPNSTQVLRSFQLMMEESFSAPMTSTVS